LHGVAAAAGAKTATVDLAAQAKEEEPVRSPSRKKSLTSMTPNKKPTSARSKAAAKKKQRAV
jgi:hypothetical protein